ncbi:hypothetical protein D3C72_1423520 [compost metagenome]
MALVSHSVASAGAFGYHGALAGYALPASFFSLNSEVFSYGTLRPIGMPAALISPSKLSRL